MAPIFRSPQRGGRGRGRGNFGNLSRTGNFNNFPRPPLYQKPVIESQPGWRDWPELKVRLNNLPPDVTPPEIYNVIKSWGGSVSVIDINKPYQGCSQAFVTYTSSPNHPFWQDGWVGYTKHGRKILAVLMPSRPDFGTTQTDGAGDRPGGALMTSDIKELAFGILETEHQVTTMRRITATATAPVLFKIDPGRREVMIFFSLSLAALGESNNGASMAEYKVVLSLQQLAQIWLRDQRTHGQSEHLVIPCEVPPKVYRKVADISTTMNNDEKHWNANKAWLRQTDIVRKPRGMQQRDEPVSVAKNDPLIDIGLWTCYSLSMLPKWRSSSFANTFLPVLEELNVLVRQNDGLLLRHSSVTNPPIWRHLGVDFSQASTTQLEELNGNTVALSWPVRYQLEACMSQNVLNPWNVTPEFLQHLAAMPEPKAVRLLEYISDEGKRIFNPMSIFNMRVPRGFGKQKVPAYCVQQRAAVIMPSGVQLSSPTVEVSNRVIRTHARHADRFLRVRFTDEKFEGKIFASDDETNDVLFNRVRRCLLHGIMIDGRHYEYLAAGNSQLREHGAFFFARAPDCNADDIRDQMGDFRYIKVVPKNASRMGQCFSTTRSFPGTNLNVMEINDVQVKDKQGAVYNFTDGVGKITHSLAKHVAALHRLDFIPSALQFRLGGSKGILVVWPDVPEYWVEEPSPSALAETDHTNADKPKVVRKLMQEVHLRHSQYKFHSYHDELEIIKPSTFVWAQLNRQLITNLECLGIDAKVFVRRMSHQLEDVDKAMKNKDAALQQLERRVDPNYVTLALADMVRSGFMESNEPFLMSCLQLWRSWIHKTLKEKASIHIEKAAFVIGVSDETGTLRGHFEDEPDLLPKIFLQVHNPYTKTCEVVRGVCILARNPSLHPGDIRVVKAVENDQLKHLKNVVVFPQQGTRDIPSMCSGGDLDGDDYFVSWDPKLLPAQSQRNYPPMTHLSHVPDEVDGDVSIPQIIDFIINYMKQDSLGRIANAWLALADNKRDQGGPKHPDCVQLAQQHSLAVDFMKTGKPAEAAVLRRLRPREYPHFMEKRWGKSYKSGSACGQLYDLVDRVEFKPQLHGVFDQRIAHYYAALPENLLQQARKCKASYDTALRRIMNQFEIKTEFEVWTAFILEHSRAIRAWELQDKIGSLLEQLKDDHRAECVALAGGGDAESLYPFVCAMYQVTAESAKSDSEPMISFPWIFWRELGKIASRSNGGNAPGIAINALRYATSTDVITLEEQETNPGQTVGVTSDTITNDMSIIDGAGDESSAEEDEDFEDAQETHGRSRLRMLGGLME